MIKNFEIFYNYNSIPYVLSCRLFNIICMGDYSDGAGQPAAHTGPDRQSNGISPKIWQIILIAFIAIAFTSVWLLTYEHLHELIWMNEFVRVNRWTIPVGVIAFSLLVGLCQKYLQAPNIIHEGLSDSMKGDEATGNYKIFPGTLLTSFFSLFSGASIGPEGCIGALVVEISAWIREKIKISKERALGFDVAALASAYNGVIGSPVFTAILATEFNVGKKDALKYLAWNLLAGIIGFLFFSLLGLESFASLLAFPPVNELSGLFVIWAIILGILGAIIAVLIGVVLKGIGGFIERTFADRIMTRILFAAIIIGVVCYFIPELMFSGENSIHSIIADPAGFGISMLLLMAVLKVLLFAISSKSGYLGGPVFPILFTCTMIGLIFSLVLPGIPSGIFVLCLMAAVVTLALGAPLTAILLITVLGVANQNMVALLVLSSVVAMVMGMGLKEIREKRAAGTIPA
jgi:H+/Cl- antiporter ClcA